MKDISVLLTYPMSSYLEQHLDTRFNLLRLWTIPDKPTFFKQHSTSIRAVVGNTTIGADRELIDSLPGLEIVSSFSVGLDKVDFLKAATAVRSRIFHTSDDESEGECVNDPWPGNGSSGDKLVGITAEVDRQDACAPKKGSELPVFGDEVVVGGREGMTDKVVEPDVPDEAEKSCVDGLQGLKIGDKEVDGEFKGRKSETNSESDDDEEDEKVPRLTEVCI